MTDFILDRVMPYFMIFALIITGGIAILMFYDHFVRETIELRKDTWECAAEHAEMMIIPAGKVMIPSQVTVCDTWKRKT